MTAPMVPAVLPMCTYCGVRDFSVRLARLRVYRRFHLIRRRLHREPSRRYLCGRCIVQEAK